jgi:hypothetical protein
LERKEPMAETITLEFLAARQRRLVLRRRHKIHSTVMAGLVPAIHD